MLQSYSVFISHSVAYSVRGSVASLLFVWACNWIGALVPRALLEIPAIGYASEYN